MEQVLIRNLPDGTKASLRARAEQHHRTVEAEARAILTETLAAQPASLVDLLADPRPQADFTWEPERVRYEPRPIEF